MYPRRYAWYSPIRLGISGVHTLQSTLRRSVPWKFNTGVTHDATNNIDGSLAYTCRVPNDETWSLLTGVQSKRAALQLSDTSCRNDLMISLFSDGLSMSLRIVASSHTHSTAKPW